ncbi:hypothetical protein M231_04262 [Tremella mesenterica]|uniref:Velvet domain-containing protein n=1 Tax=Tremella mesenterica TaxID=5217 RepID=A0A4Q1BL91_TREME|nr:hypothetical protein M231_04262 [Tremella mesenterica]
MDAVLLPVMGDRPVSRQELGYRSLIGGDTRKREMKNKKNSAGYVMRIWQQPERARLCSYKEVNETIDRRPVDPPPVVILEGYPESGNQNDIYDSTSLFIRASIVQATPIADERDPSIPFFPPVKTPTGADATAGESIQNPQKVKGLDGRPAAVCIFAKLSVRVPGVFRLKFTLFETSELVSPTDSKTGPRPSPYMYNNSALAPLEVLSHVNIDQPGQMQGISQVACCVSDTFEVFSPKLFKGMRESTPLTRHLAAQGLKVKLRTDTTVGRRSESRRQGKSQAQVPISSRALSEERSPSQSSSNHPHSPVSQQAHQPALPPPPAVGVRHSRSLVWRPSLNLGQEEGLRLSSFATRSPSSSPLDVGRKVRRTGDDGTISSSRIGLSFVKVTAPSLDLSEFSLSTPTDRRPPPVPLAQSASYIHSPSLEASSSYSSWYSTSRTSSSFSDRSISHSTLPRMRRESIYGHDGIPRLPLPSENFIPSGVSALLGSHRMTERPVARGTGSGSGSGSGSGYGVEIGGGAGGQIGGQAPASAPSSSTAFGFDRTSPPIMLAPIRRKPSSEG